MGAIERELLLRDAMAQGHRQLPPDNDRTFAAVALIVATDEHRLLFIKRSQSLGDPWSGQVALPGGRQDTEDEDLEATAKRETLEEVGLSLNQAHFWGTLDAVQARSREGVSKLWVVPHVYRIEGPAPTLFLHSREVAATRWISIDDLLNPELQQQIEFQTSVGPMKLPAWVIDDFTIWGLTYLMVRRFLAPLLSK